MGLHEYHAKRDFSATPEPKGAETAKKPTKKPGHKLRFVIQEHHATALHYDFRLEMDGVLKSWAVPKGPSLNPHEQRLAVQTEDHPYSYRTFEGVIPRGSYGAGNVIIWDEGWYEARMGDPKASEKTLLKELEQGHITFTLHGKKLHGEFALIKMPHASDEHAWLLIKKGDSFASETVDITKQDESVVSKRHVDDLGSAAVVPDLSSYPKVATPWEVRPMLCTLVDEPFDRQDWLFEVKWDGYRAIASKKSGEIALYSRAGNTFASKYPPVAEAMHAIKHDVILDGEVVVVDEDGASHFEWLQQWEAGQRGTLRYYVFDILWYDGRDVRTMPLRKRKALLRHVLPEHNDVLFYSDHIEADGNTLFKAMERRHLEGMVAKNAESPYREGNRGNDWLKIKTHQRQEVVIGGYTEPRGGRKYLGALIVGVFKNGSLEYVGHSGGGIPDEQRRILQQKLARIERKTSPFRTEPKPNAPVHWVRPEVICEMSFSEWTDDGRMRHPVFEGLREDKKPHEVHAEKTKHTPTAALAASRKEPAFELTHLDKVFFPKRRYTKGDLIKYYESVAEYILPYIKDRPCSLLRMPNGITGEAFFQKNNEHLPDWVPHADIFSESNNANLRWIVGGTLETLLYMVQLGCVEINPWNSRTQHLEKPDWLVIDLDPEGVPFTAVVQVAQTVHKVCEEWRIPAYPKTSGKTGIHIFVPLGAKYTHEQAKNLAHLLALEINRREPELTSVERLPKKRPHKIYLDFLQNREGQTLAAPYSVRPTPEASVSMPLHWDEVVPSLKPSDYTIKNALARLSHTKDIWKPVLGKGIDMQAVLTRLESTRQ